MKIRNLSLLLLVLVLVLSACQSKETTKESIKPTEDEAKNLNKSGMPIVKDSITFNFFQGQAPATNDNWNDVLIWNTYEKMTNINVKWKAIPYSGLSEKRNLALASGNYPDAFYGAWLPATDLFKYGKQGVFLPLNDLIDEHAPNIKKLFEKYPSIQQGLTFPNGIIYSLPMIYDPEFTAGRMSTHLFVNEDWLKALGMDEPKTLEEYYQYLKAVKEQDPNGNGKNDEIPYGGTDIASIINQLKGAWGLGNRGALHSYVDVDPDSGELRFIQKDPKYKELLQYAHKLYSEKLIQQNIFSIQRSQYMATASKGLYGSIAAINPDAILGQENYTSLQALEGPHGDHMFANFFHPLVNLGAFAMTNKNEHPVATIKWIDYFYGQEGQKLFFMGVEGKTYKETSDGDVKYLDKITNNPDGLTFDQAAAEYLTWPGGGYPGVVSRKFFKGSESQPTAIEAMKKKKDDLPKEVWPPFTYAEEESRDLATIKADMDTYIEEMEAKFITGEVPFSEWDQFVNTLQDMGVEKFMEIQQAAYERYQSGLSEK
ncbi:extracellular solute-binding protein [Pseudalkalibacillus decolorationis]|uniref:extracellular solute-binding protein n=1 Tax=Pseudalkalibacillus decolorationis TaxID=163879 RepID=UPI002148B738|nr:extracellular solute-binding protein [Pseudalkalibacillus decolorationis]